jgi:hypothetical protein
LLVVLQSEVVQSLLTTTYITEEFKLRTSCNNNKKLVSELRGGLLLSPFFFINTIKEENYGKT